MGEPAEVIKFASAEDEARYRARRQRSARAQDGGQRDNAPGRVLPHSIEAEEHLLSCCLLDGAEVLAKCIQANLRADSFYDPKHGIVFARLMDMLARGVPLELATVAEELRESRQLEQIGGYAFLVQVSSRAPTTAQAAYFIEKVREQAKLREIIRVGAALVEDCYGFSGGIDEFAAQSEARILDVTSTARRSLPEVLKWGELVGPTERPAPAELVGGVLYRGGKLMLGGGSKSFKTWVLLDMALSVATGKGWWGMKTTQAPVLFVNFELQTWSFERRVRAICKAKGIESAPDFYVWNLRGRARDFRELRVPLLNKLRRFKIGLGILDPIYKCLGERDENSNGEVGDLLNEVESVAVDADCAMVHGHHFAKGDSSEKDKRDLTSGAGAWMRDPDSSIVLRPHEEEDCFTAEFILRDLEPRKPMVVMWEKPVMVGRDHLDPSALRKAGRPKENTSADVVRVLEEGPAGGLSFGQWLKASGLTESTFKRLRTEAVESGRVVQFGQLYTVKK